MNVFIGEIYSTGKSVPSGIQPFCCSRSLKAYAPFTRSARRRSPAQYISLVACVAAEGITLYLTKELEVVFVYHLRMSDAPAAIVLSLQVFAIDVEDSAVA